MSIDDYWAGMGVKHTEKNCKVCQLDLPPSERRRGFLSRLWQKAWFVWLLVLIVVVGAYILAVHEIYNIVGGIR